MADIGIMGGTFDPVHNGHLILGKQAYEEYGLDAVWFMPSGQPPHKKDRHVTPAGDRCAMVKLAIGDFPGFVFVRQIRDLTAQRQMLLSVFPVCYQERDTRQHKLRVIPALDLIERVRPNDIRKIVSGISFP